ncbi:MAG: response regulator [Candidatus Midichloriaceae bacterium]
MIMKLVKSNKQSNILIVEDNTYIRNLVISLLKKEDYNIISASNAFEAMDLMEHYGAKFLDLIITDYQMPDFNGVDFVKKVKSKKDFQNIPIILLSQYNNLFFTKNKNEDVLKMFDSIIHKTDMYKFLMQEVSNLLLR